jgi:hypothetical protein
VISEPNTWQEPRITINGVELSIGQAMTMRVALSAFDCDCGDDEHGKAMTAGYKARTNEIFRLMAPPEGTQR